MNRTVAVEAEEIDIGEMFGILWRGKRLILSVTLIIMVAVGAASLFMDNEYQASGLLAPNQSGDDLAGGLLSQFGGLASLAGISLGGGKTDPATIAIETLQSQVFLAEFIRKHELKIPLFAAKNWDLNKKEWIIDASVFDAKAAIWTRPAKPPRAAEPSDIEAVEEFRKYYTVKQDKKTGLVTVTFISRSPEMAKQLIDWIVADVNEYLRESDASEARESIEYLKRQLEQTTVAEMQKVFYQLIEQQTKAAMLAEVRQQYAFRVIDYPVTPEEKHGPKRAMLIFLSGLLAGVLSCLIVLLRDRMGRIASENAHVSGL